MWLASFNFPLHPIVTLNIIFMIVTFSIEVYVDNLVTLLWAPTTELTTYDRKSWIRRDLKKLTLLQPRHNRRKERKKKSRYAKHFPCKQDLYKRKDFQFTWHFPTLLVTSANKVLILKNCSRSVKTRNHALYNTRYQYLILFMTLN